MKAVTRPNDLGTSLVRFFQDYLPTLRGMSPHTIHSYRDALVLLLRFLGPRHRCSIDRLDLSAITAKSVTDFLHALETERHNGIGTRNSRLPQSIPLQSTSPASIPSGWVSFRQFLGYPSSGVPEPNPSSILNKSKSMHCLRP